MLPPIVSALIAFVATLFRSNISLRLANVALRHPLAVYKHTVRWTAPPGGSAAHRGGSPRAGAPPASGAAPGWRAPQWEAPPDNGASQACPPASPYSPFSSRTSLKKFSFLPFSNGGYTAGRLDKPGARCPLPSPLRILRNPYNPSRCSFVGVSRFGTKTTRLCNAGLIERNHPTTVSKSATCGWKGTTMVSARRIYLLRLDPLVPAVSTMVTGASGKLT